MRIWRSIILMSLFAQSMARGAPPAFSRPPAATGDGTQVRISFAVSAAAAVEVAIVDGDGRILRHLAAGLLGPGAPAPFAAGQLEQTLVWDRKDDAGELVTVPASVRVGIGLAPRLERHIGFDPYTFRNIMALAVNAQGELFVLDSQWTYGASSMRVHDRDGKYLRTVMPYSAALTPAQTDPIGQLTTSEGVRVPIVYNAHGHNLSPYASGMKYQTMAFDPQGRLAFFSSVGTIVEHGPPRFLLFMDGQGGAAPDYGYIGPPLQPARNFLGGAGEGSTRYFDHVAASPDGRYFYVAGGRLDKPRHAIYRIQPSDREMPLPWLGERETAGSDERHFNNPQGLATDSQGRLYVADRGNDRVIVCAPDGQRLGGFVVTNPLQLAVHRASGEIYVTTVRSDNRGRPEAAALLKYGAFRQGAEPPLRAALEGLKGDLVMALDHTATPPRLWLAVRAAFGQDLAPVTDKGDRLELGAGLGRLAGLRQPMFISADAPRGKVYVTELSNSQRQLDIATGALAVYHKGGEAVADRDGNVHVVEGYPPNVFLYRYDKDGKPLNYPGTASNKAGPINTASKGPHVGFRGHCVAANGDIYILEMSFYGDGKVNVYAPDGKLKQEGVITHVPNGASGIAVDRQGNIFVGPNIKPTAQPYPPDFQPILPPHGWVWWRKPQPEPWNRTYYNAYLYHWGMIFKFPPAGGGFYRDFKEVGSSGAPPMQIPPEAKVYSVGYLNGKVGVVGALWGFHGYGPIAATNLNWGDPSCVCLGARMCVDDFGRVYVPDPFRFAINVLDANGNLIGRIGRYGNADDPGIAFAWGAFASWSGGRLFVGDTSNRRVSLIAVEAAQSAVAAIAP